MLTIDVKFVASELTPGLTDGEISIEDGATVRELILQCASQRDTSVPPDNFAMMYPLFNGKPLTVDGALTKDGTLHICRVVLGG